MLIAIDAGHNAYPDTGATGLVQEDVWTKELAAKVISKLNNLGYQTVDVTPYGQRFNSVTASLEYRVNKANNTKADIYAALHFNVTPGGTGTEIYAISDSGRAIANKILPEICNAFGYYNRGVKQDNLFVLKYTDMPAVLVEGCFIDNTNDVGKYDVNKMANAIVKGITGQTIQPQPINSDYDHSIPTGDNIFKIGNFTYIEETLDGRTIIHNDRANYITLGKGFSDVYWNDGKGNKGSRRLSN